MEQEKERKKKEELSDLFRIIFSLSWGLCIFFSPGLVFALKKNLDFLRTSAPYLLHHAPKISKMSDYSSVLGEIMQEIWRSPISLTAPCFSETCCPAASGWRSGWTGSERGAARGEVVGSPWEHGCQTHACTWIKIIGCYGDGRQMMLFADSLMALCQIIRCHRAAGILHQDLPPALCTYNWAKDTQRKRKPVANSLL